MFKKFLLIFLALTISACANRGYDDKLVSLNTVGIINISTNNYFGIEVDQRNRVGSETYATTMKDLDLVDFGSEYARKLILAKSKYKVVDFEYDRTELLKKYLFSNPDNFQSYARTMNLPNSTTKNILPLYVINHKESIQSKVSHIRKELIVLANRNKIDAFIIIAPGIDIAETTPPLLGSYGMIKQEFIASNNVEPFAAPEMLFYDVRTDELLKYHKGKVKSQLDDQTFFDLNGPQFRFRNSLDFYDEDEYKMLQFTMKDLLKFKIYTALKSFGLVDYNPQIIVPQEY